MKYVRVYHNVETDAQDRPQGFFGHKNGAAMTLVFAYTEPDRDLEPAQVLEQAFYQFNEGNSDLAEQYRAMRLRSLSVGDVVVVDTDAYACESLGWERRHAALNVTNRADLPGTVPLHTV